MSRTILYVDCFAGISGDMTVAALLDLGGDFALLTAELSKLGLDSEFRLARSSVRRTGITATRFEVHTPGDALEDHDHPHHGPAPESPPAHEGHEHAVERGRHALAGHEHSSHSHGGHEHRAYREIVSLIRGAGLSDRVSDLACSLFETIAVAEGKIHGVPVAEVHFHEVGAIDSIVDIVAIAVLVDSLGADRIIGAPVPLGRGLVRTMHGLYPVPAPATLEIVKGYPIQASELAGELTTPTGAAVLATLAQERGPIPSMEVRAVGYGAGAREFEDHPNVLRLLLGSER